MKSVLIFILFHFVYNQSMYSNAIKVYNFLIRKSWTITSISVVLAHMQAESGINPYLETPTENGGYGLLQWTPKNKVLSWSNFSSLDPFTSQCEYLNNGNNYILTDNYKVTFNEFKNYTNNTNEIEYLTKLFYSNYQHHTGTMNPIRTELAKDWMKKLEKIEPRRELYYEVVYKDSLSLIAMKYGISLDKLLELNPGLNASSNIEIGQIIRVR